jgi:hypothetical protein
MQYNAKINTNGEYTKFYGWSIILPVENDLKFIENFIKNNNVLNKFFSGLPSSSYHMTLYNLWSNGNELIPHQKEFIKKNFSEIEQKELEIKSKSLEFFNPKGCINDLLFKLHFICDQSMITNLKFKINKVVYTGNTLQILLESSVLFDNINKLRQVFTNVCQFDDNMKLYHITLAYKYKDIDEESNKKIVHEICILNMLLDQQTIILNKPFVCYFSDMKEFVPFIQSL